MPLIACGINHKSAPVELREKVVFYPEKLALYLQDLLANEGVREVVLLSTCNRSEIYCEADSLDIVQKWFYRQHGVAASELKKAWFCYDDQEAIEHIMRVAAGLDSMILGEPQILGQMKDAFSEACAAGSVGPRFNRLFQQVFSVAKEIRTHTAIGACPVSIASAAVNLAKQNFSQPLSQANILLVGAGDTIQLVLRYLQSQGVKQSIIANRNLQNSKQLAEQFNSRAIALEELQTYLSQTDILISATGSPVPILTKDLFQQRAKPIIIVDIAVPRDVEAAVAELPDVLLYSIDALKNIIQHNLHGREHAAEKAQQVIKTRSQEFIAWMQSIDEVAATIRIYRQQIENLRDKELDKAQRQLQRGDDPIQVLAQFANTLTNKVLHHPSAQLRQAGVEGRFDLLQLAQQLFAIPKTETT